MFSGKTADQDTLLNHFNVSNICTKVQGAYQGLVLNISDESDTGNLHSQADFA